MSGLDQASRIPAQPFALHYHPDGFSMGHEQPMGRQAAGASFLEACFRHLEVSQWPVYVNQAASVTHFQAQAQRLGRKEPVQPLGRHRLHELAQVGLLLESGPNLSQHARHRALFGHRHWSLCGITHTTSSDRAMDAITDLLLAPVQPHDALICTSTAVHQHVMNLLQAQQEELRERLGATRFTLPQLPIIPLGIHPQDFEFSETDQQQARAALGIAPEAVVVLFLGRLSFHAKAHPLALYQALEVVAQASHQPLVLVECGWFANDAIESAFDEAMAQVCPSVQRVRLPGHVSEQRNQAWACADVFCSLSDNIQETFGITPIEAMAAGLPVLVSDWNGYRDSIRHGIDGFRVPTLMPSQGQGEGFSVRHALGLDTYDQYCGATCMTVAVDLDQTIKHLRALVQSPGLRQEMGQNGRQRVRSLYDWRVVLGQYNELWADLRERRAAVALEGQPAKGWAARPDPYTSFAHYPTHTLNSTTTLSLRRADLSQTERALMQLTHLRMVNFAKSHLPSPTDLMALIQPLSEGPQTVQKLTQELLPHQRPGAIRGLAFLCKLGLLKT
jgi:glycosyltransferase involved in cell wall biosynthesis